MADLCDDDLWRLYQQGDTQAFEVLFCRHYAAVYHHARTMLSRPDLAEEVLQETFLAIARHADSYQPRGNGRGDGSSGASRGFRGWILTITRNQCLNRLAARKAQQTALTLTGLQWAEPESSDPQPSEVAERNEDLAWLEQAIVALPVDQREALSLLIHEQMTYPQIAELLELPLGTVKTLIHRAKARLADHWQKTPQEHRP